MSHPLCFSIHEIKEWLAAGPPYPVDPSRDLVYPSAGYVDSGNIKTTRDPLALPDSMMLQIFPEACSRHATLGSILRGYKNRTWLLKLQEADLVTGKYIDQVEQAVKEMIQERHPKIIFLCGTCIDQLLGTDYDSLGAKLEKRWGVRFGTAYMEPMMKDKKLPFKSKDLRALHSVIRADPDAPKKRWVNLIGRPLPPAKESELYQVLKQAGIERVLHFSEAGTVEELDDMGRACLNIGLEKRAKMACELMERKHHIPYVLLDNSFLPEEIHDNYIRIGQALGCELNDLEYGAEVKRELSELLPRLTGMKIAVGETIQARSLKAAAELAELGFQIDSVFTLTIQKEDIPFVEILCSRCPQSRVYFSGSPEILSYCAQPETFDLVLGLSDHYYAGSPMALSFSANSQYCDYYSVLSLTHRIQTELDRGKENEVPGYPTDQHNRYDQKYLRERLRAEAEQKAKDIGQSGCLKRWGVYR